jgi:adenylate cyclase
MLIINPGFWFFIQLRLSLLSAPYKETMADIWKERYDELRRRFESLSLEYTSLKTLKKELEKKVAGYEKQVKELETQPSEPKGNRYKMVTVLFADVKGFSELTGQSNAEDLVDELDAFFLKIDEIIRHHNIEKTSSIGDTYMAAGGIPRKNRTNPIEVVLAAIEMQELMNHLEEQSLNQGKKAWNITLGIHTGPVVASSTGKKKISYELKGDTVNIASRIESSCEPGKIYISEMTHELVSEYFRCEYRSKIPVKYLGDINMYHVKGFRPEYSIDGEGIRPNKQFITRFQLIRYDDLEEFMLDKLERELPKYLYYHNLKHTIDVCIQVEVIGRGEGISDEELLLLKTAALFHDSGQIIQSKDHEYLSTRIAREILPRYHYSDEQVYTICEIIMATMLPPKPVNKLQKIICDADLDYLGRSDFVPVSNTLYTELHEQKLVGTLNDWNKLQIKFISGHRYFTKTANSLREVNKQKQIERIRSLLTTA